MRAVVIYFLVVAAASGLCGDLHVTAVFGALAALAFMVRWGVMAVSAARARRVPPPVPPVNPETQAIREMRLVMREMGRDDGELSDADIKAFCQCVRALCTHGRLTKRALGSGRISITLEMPAREPGNHPCQSQSGSARRSE